MFDLIGLFFVSLNFVVYFFLIIIILKLCKALTLYIREKLYLYGFKTYNEDFYAYKMYKDVDVEDEVNDTLQ